MQAKSDKKEGGSGGLLYLQLRKLINIVVSAPLIQPLSIG